jgi:hypothetical protein
MPDGHFASTDFGWLGDYFFTVGVPQGCQIVIYAKARATPISLMLPAVSSKASGRPSPSLNAWSLLALAPRDGPIAWR